MWVAAILSTGIGLSLGLLGAGGSILALPVLVYGAGIPPNEAVAPSLVLVGVTSLVASLAHARAGKVDLGVALRFGGAGLLGALAGAHLTDLVPARALMLTFAALLFLVGFWMARGARGAAPRRRSPAVAAAAGVGVGALTGFLGVGGGFVVVPALVATTGLPVATAIGTSLVVIVMNSAAGFVGHLGQPDLHLGVTALFTGLAGAGALVGARLANRLPARHLRRGFAALIVLVATFVTVHNLVA